MDQQAATVDQYSQVEQSERKRWATLFTRGSVGGSTIFHCYFAVGMTTSWHDAIARESAAPIRSNAFWLNMGIVLLMPMAICWVFPLEWFRQGWFLEKANAWLAGGLIALGFGTFGWKSARFLMFQPAIGSEFWVQLLMAIVVPSTLIYAILTACRAGQADRLQAPITG